MKAVLCKAYGPPESLVVEEIASPRPEAGEAVITVKAASVVSFVDTQTGLLPRTEIEKRVAAHAAEMPVQRWQFDALKPRRTAARPPE